MKEGKLMVINHSILIKTAILSITVFCHFEAIGQSLHVSKWIVGGYLFDFTEKTVVISKSEDKLHGINGIKYIYVDNTGTIKLMSNDKTIYDSEGNVIKDIPNVGYFAPVPNNENIVCGFADNMMYKIDIESNTIISEENLECDGIFKAVHNTDCSSVWLIDEKKKCKLNTDGNIENVIQYDDNKEYLPTSNWILSWDCKYFAVGETPGWDDSKLIFGKFNRRNATFNQTASYIVKNKRFTGNPAFSPDNSKVYYALYHDRTMEVIEIPIVDDIPIFEKERQICKFNYRPPIIGIGMHFGLDGRLYFFNMKKLSVVDFSDADNPKFIENFMTLETNVSTLAYTKHLFDWYSSTPCSGIPCPDISAPIIIAE